MNTQKALNLNLLVLDERLQSRVEINEDMVAEYAHDMKQGDQFPPVTVHFDGVQYYLTDGFHRYHAARRIEKASIVANIIHGTFRDAEYYSLCVNKDHGMRRSNADKRRAVQRALDDFEWSMKSNMVLARDIGVSEALVSNMRNELEKRTDTVQYVTPTGKIAEKKRAPGRKKQEKVEEPEEEEARDDTSESDAQQELIGILTKQLEDTRAQAAINLMDASDEEKKSAENLIKELQEENRVLKIELESVRASRDTFQNENAQLKKQVAMLMKKLKAQK